MTFVILIGPLCSWPGNFNPSAAKRGGVEKSLHVLRIALSGSVTFFHIPSVYFMKISAQGHSSSGQDAGQVKHDIMVQTTQTCVSATTFVGSISNSYWLITVVILANILSAIFCVWYKVRSTIWPSHYESRETWQLSSFISLFIQHTR